MISRTVPFEPAVKIWSCASAICNVNSPSALKQLGFIALVKNPPIEPANGTITSVVLIQLSCEVTVTLYSPSVNPE